MPLINAESSDAIAVDNSVGVAVLPLSDELVPLLAFPVLPCALINEFSKSTAFIAPLDAPEPSIEIRPESDDSLTAVLVIPLITLLLAVVLETLAEELVAVVPTRLAIKLLEEEVSIVVIALYPKTYAVNIALIDRVWTCQM